MIPLGLQFVRQTAGGADQLFAEGAAADADQQPFRRRPGTGDGAGLHVGPHLVVDPGGGAAQGQFPQGHEVAGLEEFLHGPGGLLRDVDLPLVQALQQILRRDVDQLDLRGPIEQAVGHGLPHGDAGDLGDDVVEALEMLDIDRGVDIDAGGEQLLHILPALLVPGAGGVGMGQFVHQDDLRLAAPGPHRCPSPGAAPPGSRAEPWG